MSCTREQAVKQMQAWVGLKESDGSHKKIIDIYNTLNPLPRGYKLSYKDPWCAGTVSAMAVACNATDIIPTECSCGKLIEKAKAMGIWVERDDYVPKPGDIMLYDWDDSGKGDCTGDPEHIGIVTEVESGQILVAEGNYENSVKIRTVALNGRYLRGYIAPNYDPEPENADFHVSMRLLRLGSTGEDVRALQILLIGRGYACGLYGANGVFGAETEDALIRFQKMAGLDATGFTDVNALTSLLGT